ncbi:MAG: transposase [Armatimonadetes bacterium]|nr:transposase [Armatimonadota bacterium]
MRQERKRPIHVEMKPFYNRPTIVFLTVCTKGRKPILCRDEVHAILRDVWSSATAWLVGRYVIMPDHIHLFSAPASEDIAIGHWVRYWKSRVSARWPYPEEQPVWQYSFWDRRLRSFESYDEKWNYVMHNPVRHGLVEDPSQWRFQGEIFVLEW